MHSAEFAPVLGDLYLNGSVNLVRFPVSTARGVVGQASKVGEAGPGRLAQSAMNVPSITTTPKPFVWRNVAERKHAQQDTLYVLIS